MPVIYDMKEEDCMALLLMDIKSISQLLDGKDP